jgi:hypothetical protein
VQWASSAKVLQDYNKTHKDQALWDPNIFGGMPSYLVSLPNKYPFIKETLTLTKNIFSWRLTYLMLGAIGVYVLATLLGFECLVAIIMALAFALTGHFVGLLDIGHNTKFRAIMFIPWIIWSMFYLRDKRNLLGLSVFSASLIAQFRANHLQITYYVLLLIVFYWIYELIEALKSKKLKEYAIFSALGVAALVLITLAVTNPFLSTYEYSKYTIRGGEEGLDKGYAQGWSLHPMELISFVVPDVYGGISSPVPGELNRYRIPAYWGWMSFTQVYYYVGLTILLLAILALFLVKKQKVLFLWIAILLFTLMSFGKFAPFLSDLLLKYLPGFNKFRVPATIMVICQTSLVLLAGFGLDSIVKNQNAGTARTLKKAFYVFAGLTLFGVVFGKLIIGSASLMKPEEAEYPTQILKQLKDVRLSMAYAGILKAGLIGLLTIGLAWLYSLRKLKKATFLIIMLVLVFLDLRMVDSKYFQGMSKAHKIEIKPDAIARYLQNDKSLFRMHYPEKSMDNTYAAFVATTGGYHGAKLSRYQKYWENPQLFNSMNFINMMNGKYILSSQDMGHPVYKSGDLKLYLNQMALPKAWFVKQVQFEKNIDNIPAMVAAESFDPAETAIIEKAIEGIGSPLTESVEVTSYDLHSMTVKVTTDTRSFLTVSEIYYPAGWKAYIDGEETEIYAANYILRGIVVPVGEHEIKMEFHPESYYTGLKLSLLGLLLTIITGLIGGYQLYRERKK